MFGISLHKESIRKQNRRRKGFVLNSIKQARKKHNSLRKYWVDKFIPTYSYLRAQELLMSLNDGVFLILLLDLVPVPALLIDV